MLLASIPPNRLTQISFPIPAILMLAGGFLSSYPQNAATWAPWSRHLHDLVFAHIPSESTNPSLPIEKLYEVDHRRYLHSVGMCCFILGVAASPAAQRVLCTGPVQFAGRVSLPVYLLHNQLLKSLFTWLVYVPGGPGQVDPITGRLRPASPGRFWIATPVFFGVLYSLAYVWAKRVDPWCDRLVKRFLDVVMQPAHVTKPALG